MNEELIYGKQYKLWREGKFIGIATWTKDKNIGNAFISLIVDQVHGVVSEVYEADEWKLIEDI